MVFWLICYRVDLKLILKLDINDCLFSLIEIDDVKFYKLD